MNGAPSLEDRLIAVRRRPSGFDYMRITLALMVFIVHTGQIVNGKEVDNSLLHGFGRPFVALILPMFFTLSGFLVAGSLQRCRTLITFFGLRVMRIVPALAFETIVSALVLGPLFTTLNLDQYFSSSTFFSYFLNVLGDIHYTLPGMFVSNPDPGVVNAQLWVLPRELKCYILLGLLFWLGLVKPSRPMLLFLLVLYTLTALYYSLAIPVNPNSPIAGDWVLIMSFISGVTIYVYRFVISWSRSLFVLSFLSSLVMLSVNWGWAFAPIPVGYATVYLGLTNPVRNRVISSGDYSYGIYLYGFPIQQAAVSLGPWSENWYVNIMIALPATVLLAMASWFLVEKPLLARRPFLTTLEDRAIAGRETMHASLVAWVRRSLSND
jgi:peptidoglycan/LPS O-acetylase OafA/YrhL